MTREDTFREWVSAAALDALDGADRSAFEAHVGGCAQCSRDLESERVLAHRLAEALPRVLPGAAVKMRVVAIAAREKPAGGLSVPAARGRRSGWLLAALPVAAALVMGIALVSTQRERDAARRAAEANRQAGEEMSNQLRSLQADLADLRRRLEEETSLRQLVAQPDSRLTPLAGVPPGSSARARVVWNAGSRAAVLLVTGLPRAPEGKAYQVWVIASGAPAPAGVFDVDAEGRATHRLPLLDETARVKTFAVTLEPAGGLPAPSGPMVLAGAV